jgi:predicted nucleic acid-binding protein
MKLIELFMGPTEMEKRYLLDSSVLYAIYTTEDRLSVKADELLKKISKEKETKLVVHPLVIIEVLSLIKYRAGIASEKFARKEIFDTNKYEILKVTINLTMKTINNFEKNESVGIIDMILIEYCLDNQIELLTFDKKMNEVWKKLKRRN